jgi:cytochrome c-type biogenesis protein CcmH
VSRVPARRSALAALLALLALLALPALAGAAAPRASFNDIEDEVMCDTCNVPLNIAESPRADQQRREIRALIARGLTKDEVKAELKGRYGPAVLALPDDEGFSLAVWLVSIAVGVALLVALALLLPRWRRRAGGPASEALAPAGPELSPADARRLDQDLARYDG